jgi:hypothetical protein
MLVTLLGIVMLLRLVQPENAESPMLMTLSGIVMLVRLMHSENAPAPMLASISTERDLPNTGPPAGHQWPVYVVNRRWWSGHQGTGTTRSHRPEASTIGR